ncbi:patatin-like phospholipase family protein [Massilia sp. YIM B02769]|uniref:SMODS-associated NUDIX domain-containing protein n=1 Tax=Massilia sp. YIM B02769 TaxID=3050129 RepID=UPI0025B7291C|nr:patatin-like phospholipase family protein [Massilia sp. YIM B02769]MDN4058032.1 patatin-like phospholipase family protein [Massilia sp. YIM B02769]
MYRNAVFQGGGVKGIALVGALEVIEGQGIGFEAVGGASAGAIVAALYAAGYSASEMRVILESVDFNSFLDSAGWGPWALYRKRGLYRGQKFQDWIHDLLKRKKVRLFKDCKKTLRIVATDLTERTLVVFDANNYPQMEVAEAVRMSMSIPFLFEPKRLGEHLMVDGGVLSNFPISLFDVSETLGLRLRSNPDSMSFAPDGLKNYIAGMVGAMLDGRDNYDVESSVVGGLIEIDPGSVSTTQFSLSRKEKDDLFERGVSAASKFFLNEGNADKGTQLAVTGELSKINLSIPKGLSDAVDVRFSISALVRIEMDDKFLLVKGRRIDQFQPVGGVLKIYRDAKAKLKKLGIKDDEKFPIDPDSMGDLRVMVPWKATVPFLQWYLEGTGRETSPWREFYEELIETKILSAEKFRAPAFERIGTRIEGVRWSDYFKCYEVLIAELFSLVPTPEQGMELQALNVDNLCKDLIWASPALIRDRGYDVLSKSQITKISEHSSWLLDASI